MGPASRGGPISRLCLGLNLNVVLRALYGPPAMVAGIRQRRYPQSGERISGRRKIQESRTVQPNKKRFSVQTTTGSGNLWVTEFILAYDGIPSFAVSIMEFRDGLVASETQYFADGFKPAASRAHLVER